MIKKIFIFIIIFYFFVLVQTSFLIYFKVWNMVPNLILFLVVVWNVFEKADNRFGLYQAIIGGFFLDIFSNRFIGFNILILVISVILIKLFFRRYVRIPFFEN